MNENCLEGLRCPNCKQEDVLQIAGTSLFRVVDDGTESHEDVEWDDASFTRCPTCGFQGKLVDFRIEKTEKPAVVEKTFEVCGYVKKRFTTVVKAVNEGDALRKGEDLIHITGHDIESMWDEDEAFYEAYIGDGAQEVEDETSSDS
jgi:Zn ribbon nucleic-acid-binding protein